MWTSSLIGNDEFLNRIDAFWSGYKETWQSKNTNPVKFVLFSSTARQQVIKSTHTMQKDYPTKIRISSTVSGRPLLQNKENPLWIRTRNWTSHPFTNFSYDYVTTLLLHNLSCHITDEGRAIQTKCWILLKFCSRS